jgi:hypothetical protein
MVNSLSRLIDRMDCITAQRFGQPVLINNQQRYAAEQAFSADLGPLTGEGTSLVVFDKTYHPERHDRVVWQGKHWRITRWSSYNGKPHICLEEDNDART